MKPRYYLFITFSFLLLASACNKRHTLAVVDHNCTGSYLEWNDRYYKVCNSEILNSYATGTTVEVRWRAVNPKDCVNDNDIICFMAVEYDGIIEILSVH